MYGHVMERFYVKEKPFIIAEKGYFLTFYRSETWYVDASISRYIPNFLVFENIQYCALKTLKTLK